MIKKELPNEASPEIITLPRVKIVDFNVDQGHPSKESDYRWRIPHLLSLAQENWQSSKARYEYLTSHLFSQPINLCLQRHILPADDRFSLTEAALSGLQYFYPSFEEHASIGFRACVAGRKTGLPYVMGLETPEEIHEFLYGPSKEGPLLLIGSGSTPKENYYRQWVASLPDLEAIIVMVNLPHLGHPDYDRNHHLVFRVSYSPLKHFFLDSLGKLETEIIFGTPLTRDLDKIGTRANTILIEPQNNYLAASLPLKFYFGRKYLNEHYSLDAQVLSISQKIAEIVYGQWSQPPIDLYHLLQDLAKYGINSLEFQAARDKNQIRGTPYLYGLKGIEA